MAAFSGTWSGALHRIERVTDLGQQLGDRIKEATEGKGRPLVAVVCVTIAADDATGEFYYTPTITVPAAVTGPKTARAVALDAADYLQRFAAKLEREEN